MSGSELAAVELREEASALAASFIPRAGMLCSSLRHRGQELLAQNDGVASYAERGKTMGIPLLYPWANRLAAFDYAVAGRTVAVPDDRSLVSVDENGLPIHGVIGGRQAWEPVARSDEASLAARLSWSESQGERFAAFPFRHELLYEARLRDGSLTIAITVRASGGDPVPLAFGFHPYLSLPAGRREGWIVGLPAMRRLDLDELQIPVGTGEGLAARRFALEGAAFDDGFDEVGEGAVFSVADSERLLELEPVEGYTCAQVYAPPSRHFICFEPMAAPTNALRSHEGLRLLAPGGEHRAVFAVRIRDLP